MLGWLCFTAALQTCESGSILAEFWCITVGWSLICKLMCRPFSCSSVIILGMGGISDDFLAACLIGMKVVAFFWHRPAWNYLRAKN